MKAAKFIPYDTGKYPFAKIIAEDVYHIPDLSRLHVYVKKMKQQKGLPATLSYPDNLALRALMDGLKDDCRFYNVYRAFITEVLAPLFGGSIRFSAHPKFRVHLAETESVSKWHTDVEYTGRHEQVNAWLPFTDAFGTNTLWVESGYGNADYRPVDVMYGEVLLFDGGYLSHGTVPNTTDATRVSIDFRFHSTKEDLLKPDGGILACRPKDYFERHIKKASTKKLEKNE